MKCTECGNAMIKSIGDHTYVESGMDHVILRNVTKYSCETCGAKRVTIVAMAQLHRAIALALAVKPARLISSEVRFIRDHLDLSNRDFAKIVGVTEEQASRWTTTESPGVPAERFIRVLASLGPNFVAKASKGEASSIEPIADPHVIVDVVHTINELPSKDEPPAKMPIRAKRSNSDWKTEIQPSPN